MASITSTSTLEEVAAIVSSSPERAGIAATLSGGAAVSIYTYNEYQSKDLDFVTAAVRYGSPCSHYLLVQRSAADVSVRMYDLRRIDLPIFFVGDIED